MVYRVPPRQSAARDRSIPPPARLAERPEVRVRSDLAVSFEFFTTLHFCVAHPRASATHPSPCYPVRWQANHPRKENF